MGSAFSRLRLTWQSFRAISTVYKEVNERLKQTPGLPASNPSTSYWAIPVSPIAQHGSDAVLPSVADIVIIGSGITGTAVARTLLTQFDTKNAPLIVMLDARDACSGATARNGGHVTPLIYHDYAALKKKHGAEMAKSILKFRFAHIAELIQVSEEESILADSQCRAVETFDVFFNQEMFDLAVQNLNAYLDEMPEQRKSWRVVGVEECVKDLQFAKTVVGAIATTAGAIHPYRFVTSILSRLLGSHPKSFQLFTHTPCLSISSSRSKDGYAVLTNKGTIQARHVVHATNGWASHLLPSMRGKIVPVRAHMSAQRPGLGLGRTVGTHAQLESSPSASAGDSVLTLTDNGANNWLGTRSFVMYGGGRYDYLTQQPSTSPVTEQSLYPPPAAEFMFGGGLAHGEVAEQAFMDEVGVADDRGCSMQTSAYLGGALSLYFGGWGAEGRDKPTDKPMTSGEESEEGRVKKLWTGILGVSADGRPWVGRLPAKVSGRPAPSKQKQEHSLNQLAPPGEWICAGYSGEGMVHAYLSAAHVAQMILGNGNDVLPDAFLVTEARWKKAKIEDLLDEF
ncbi:nucleotide-binding domain-containing protein [Mycena metata]|uniref:Nucleotide-binding domain-containing protein n=1 Tax=Mycena metata TaxID=1033252 RepID=A0AAD7J8T1_9AGAR|nr:nucleotide-binding domain-containing protein [Mycena metata]